jgi:plastocyanin
MSLRIAAKRHSARIGGLLALAVGVMLAAPAAASASVETHTYTLPITSGGYEVKQGFMLAPHPDVDGSITRMEVDIVDADGQPVPIQRLMLHHIVFINASRPDKTCGAFTLFDNRTTVAAGERFYAAGEERAKMALPPGYGYRLNDTDTWALTYMVMNHRSAVDSAFIQYKVTVDTDPSLAAVKPYWLDVRNCQADPIYTVPGTGDPGSTHVESHEFTMPEAGRIVAGGGHVHGGAYGLSLREPDCGDREIGESSPTWGLPDHPFYNVRPVLHEPGPINMSAFTTQSGIPIAAGERLRLDAVYDNSLPHMRVMGIMMIYVAPDAGVTDPCGPLPGDVNTLVTDQPGRAGPIPYEIPLTRLNKKGEAVTVNRPPGKTKRLRSGSTIEVGDRYFKRPNVRVKPGAELAWRFSGYELHNLTLANGPVGIASPNLDRGRVFSVEFDEKGTYRFFCGLHPVHMSERVVVGKGNRKRGPAS